MKTQEEKIYKHLMKKGVIDSYTAFEKYGITRLSAVIFNLRKKGINIETERFYKKCANYTLKQ